MLIPCPSIIRCIHGTASHRGCIIRCFEQSIKTNHKCFTINATKACKKTYTLLNVAGEEGFEPSHAGIKIQCLNHLTTPQKGLAGEEGFEPSHAGIKIQCLNHLTTPQKGLAGEEGFEPSHAGIKIQCLNHLTTPHH